MCHGEEGVHEEHFFFLIEHVPRAGSVCIFCEISRLRLSNSPPNFAILLFKSLFPETNRFPFCPIFGTSRSCASIKSI